MHRCMPRARRRSARSRRGRQWQSEHLLRRRSRPYLAIGRSYRIRRRCHRDSPLPATQHKHQRNHLQDRQPPHRRPIVRWRRAKQYRHWRRGPDRRRRHRATRSNRLRSLTLRVRPAKVVMRTQTYRLRHQASRRTSINAHIMGRITGILPSHTMASPKGQLMGSPTASIRLKTRAQRNVPGIQRPLHRWDRISRVRWPGARRRHHQWISVSSDRASPSPFQHKPGQDISGRSTTRHANAHAHWRPF